MQNGRMRTVLNAKRGGAVPSTKMIWYKNNLPNIIKYYNQKEGTKTDDETLFTGQDNIG